MTMKEKWTYKKLGEVAYYPNKRIAMKELSQHPYVGVENLIKDKGGVSFSETIPCIDSAIECQENDILIGNIRPYLRKIWLSDQKVGASGDIVVIRISQDHVNKLAPKFLYTVLSSDLFFNYDNANTKGAKMPRGDRKAIANYIIPIPPLPEQSRIVSELDLLQSIIDKQQAQLKELDTLAQAVFYDMFGDLEASKYTLIELCDSKDDIKCGPFGTQLSKTEYQKSGVAVWGIPQINSHFRIPPSDYVSEEKAINLKDYSVIAGDIVMSRKGNVGQCCVFPKSFSSGIIHSDVLRLRLNPHKADSLFMMYQLHLSKNVKYQIQLVSSGAIMPGINVTKLKNIVVEVPPLPLQQSFASKIESIEKQKAAISQSIAETQKLFDYTMDKYFG